MTKTDIAKIAQGNISEKEMFTKLLNTTPPRHALQKTPDGKADIMPISFIETKLDEVYLRQWGTENVQIQQIANEVLVWLDLWVIDPQTGLKITRSGFAAVQIMVDAVPDNIKNNRQARNAWSLDMANKKPNAMYLAFPKAKSLAIKNAAQTLGNIFGRNLNRKHEDTPGEFYGAIAAGTVELEEAKKLLQGATTQQEFAAIWNQYPGLQDNEEFKKEYLYRQRMANYGKYKEHSIINLINLLEVSRGTITGNPMLW